jgi:hypothetical protein
MGTRSLDVFVILTLAASSCVNRAGRAVDPTLLWAPPEAKVELAPHVYLDGSADLRFAMGPGADRDQLSQALMRHFGQGAWQQRTTMRRGGSPPSFQDGWQTFPGGGVLNMDNQGRPLISESRYWHGEWENARGETIAYHLAETRYPDTSRNRLIGYATYLPAR